MNDTAEQKVQVRKNQAIVVSVETVLFSFRFPEAKKVQCDDWKL